MLDFEILLKVLLKQARVRADFLDGAVIPVFADEQVARLFGQASSDHFVGLGLGTEVTGLKMHSQELRPGDVFCTEFAGPSKDFGFDNAVVPLCAVSATKGNSILAGNPAVRVANDGSVSLVGIAGGNGNQRWWNLKIADSAA